MTKRMYKMSVTPENKEVDDDDDELTSNFRLRCTCLSFVCRSFISVLLNPAQTQKAIYCSSASECVTQMSTSVIREKGTEFNHLWQFVYDFECMQQSNDPMTNTLQHCQMAFKFVNIQQKNKKKKSSEMYTTSNTNHRKKFRSFLM